MNKKLLFVYALSLLSAIIVEAKYTVVPAKSSRIKNIIFDVGDVIIQTKTSYKLSLAFSDAATFFTLLSHDIKKQLYQILSEVKAETDSTIKTYNQNEPMPQLITDWMIIPNSAEKIQTKALEHLEKSKHPNKKIVKKIISHMFNPTEFIKSQELIPATEILAKALKKNKYRLYILSNFANDAFKALKNKFNKFFSLFNGIMISADEKMVKPETKFFKHLLNTYNLQAQQCAFIDDEPHNIRAANILGIHGVLRTSDESVIKGLSKIGVMQGKRTYRLAFKEA